MTDLVRLKHKVELVVFSTISRMINLTKVNPFIVSLYHLVKGRCASYKDSYRIFLVIMF